jgi:hypothetical protein
MAVYKLFPSKDATLYSEFTSKNTGIDEILEVSKKVAGADIYLSRILMQFDQSDIANIVTTKVSGSFSCWLKLFTANAEELPTTYSLEFKAVGSEWNMGTGRYTNLPETTNGASWNYNYNDSNPMWVSTGSLATSSYVVGGGNWVTSSTSVTQSYTNYLSNKDIYVNITPIIQQWVSGSYTNNGILIKRTDTDESNLVEYGPLKYFSRDTNTIYSPYLEFKWNSISYVTSSGNIKGDDYTIVTINNNRGTYRQGERTNIRLNVRDIYPRRSFQTSSVFITTNILPSSSYYSVVDLHTNEVIVDYDTTGTRIGADTVGSYFDMDFSGLQPERYYKFVFKINYNSVDKIIDNDYIFKIVRP